MKSQTYLDSKDFYERLVGGVETDSTPVEDKADKEVSYGNIRVPLKITNEEVNSIREYMDSIETELTTVSPENAEQETNVSKYITSLATGCYAKSVDEIANTKVGNKVVRKRNLQQVMRESFFYGANRFGNNFIA